MFDWLPHAGITEIGQLAFALCALVAHALQLRSIWNDGVHVEETSERYPTFAESMDYFDARRVVNFNLLGEITLLLIQLVLVVNGVQSLFEVPPPPNPYETDVHEYSHAWYRQHVTLFSVSLLCLASSLIAWYGRKQILRPQLIKQKTRKAVAEGERNGVDTSLFDKLGGQVALDGITADLDQRLLHDPQLAPYFVGVDMKHLQHSQKTVLSAVLRDAPHEVDLQKAHERLGVTDEHFSCFVRHLRESLQSFGVAHELTEQIVAAIEATRALIIGGTGATPPHA